jgi:hypothetical protein
MISAPQFEDDQRPHRNPHGSMASSIYLVLSITLLMTRVIDFDPAIFEALAYLALAECYRRAYS